MYLTDDLFDDHLRMQVLYQENHRGSHEQLDFDIEKYFHDIKHVRKVPLQVVASKLRESSNIHSKNRNQVLYDLKQYCKTFGSLIENECVPKLTVSSFSHEKNMANQYLRKVIKFHWLVHDLQENKLCDPPICLIRHGGVSCPTFHPGGMRSSACDMLGLNPECIVYDLFNEFAEYPKLEWKDILEMYGEPRSLSVDWHYFHTYGIPDLANQHQDGILENCDTIWTEWSDKSLYMWDKPLNIFIGYDSTHNNMSDVCAASIIQQLDVDRYPDILDHIQIHKIDLGFIPEYNREYKNQSTEFTYSRFLVPYLSNYEGISIFVDDDFIFTESPLDLFYFVHHDSPVACVQHKHKASRKEKMNGVKNTSYPKKLWSSMMVFNNAHPDCKKLTPEVINTESGKYLHQFKWASKINKIPDHFVWTEGYDDPALISKRRALHFTHGGPWIAGMDCTDIEGLNHYYEVIYGGKNKIEPGKLQHLNWQDYIRKHDD